MRLNYRHAFHAGNFADLVKHAALLAVLDDMLASPGPMTIIDTHAGRGLYDLASDEAQRSGEAKAGIGRLMQAQDLPQAMLPLRSAVVELNRAHRGDFYPGSPLLIASRLRAQDHYLACELRPEEYQALALVLRKVTNATPLCVDGYGTVAEKIPGDGKVLVLIDPPFERADDYGQIVVALARIVHKNPLTQVLIWLPLKDLETFDGFLRDAEDCGAGSLTIVEARMRPLVDPMKMNGCALVLAGIPPMVEGRLRDIADWTVRSLGSQGQARIWHAAR